MGAWRPLTIADVQASDRDPGGYANAANDWWGARMKRVAKVYPSLPQVDVNKCE